MEILMIICIYCLQNKSVSQFSRKEHVLPQSFGMFKDNLTLIEKVCDNCNQHMGDKLELRFARYSMAGISRYKHGIKFPSEFKGLGSEPNLIITLQEEGYDELILKLDYSSEHNALVVTPKPQVKLLKNDGAYELFLLENLPSKEILNNDEYLLKNEKGIIIPVGVDIELVKAALATRGINFIEQGSIQHKPTPVVDCVIVENIDEKLLRVVYKIAFNYLAYFNSAEVMIQPIFNCAREFILNGVKPNLLNAQFEYAPNINRKYAGVNAVISPKGVHHVLCITTLDNFIIAHIDLFPWLQYKLNLAIGDSPKVKTNVGHVFDLKEKQVSRII